MLKNYRRILFLCLFFFSHDPQAEACSPAYRSDSWILPFPSSGSVVPLNAQIVIWIFYPINEENLTQKWPHLKDILFVDEKEKPVAFDVSEHKQGYEHLLILRPQAPLQPFTKYVIKTKFPNGRCPEQNCLLSSHQTFTAFSTKNEILSPPRFEGPLEAKASCSVSPPSSSCSGLISYFGRMTLGKSFPESSDEAPLYYRVYYANNLSKPLYYMISRQGLESWSSSSGFPAGPDYILGPKMGADLVIRVVNVAGLEDDNQKSIHIPFPSCPTSPSTPKEKGGCGDTNQAWLLFFFLFPLGWRMRSNKTESYEIHAFRDRM